MKLRTIKEKLTLLHEVEPALDARGHKIRRVLIRCACGVEFVGRRTIFTSDKAKQKECKSCGIKTMAAGRVTHGLTQHELYKTWRGMMNRCYVPTTDSYERYGGIGIAVCSSWQDICNFVKDMHPRPKGATLDRIDPFGNYEPDNCRWATAVEQAQNRKVKYFWIIESKKYNSLREASEDFGVSISTIHRWSKQNDSLCKKVVQER